MTVVQLLRRIVRGLLDPRADLSHLGLASAGDGALPRMKPGQHRVVLNAPLISGGLIVLALFVGVLFGPVIAPKNPYLSGRHVTEYVDGEVVSPPFAPSAQYPLGTDELGRDTLSMLLYGTRNTLVAAAFITMARLVVGLILGGWAGWNEGELVDRLVMGSIQMLISVPMLLLAIILILALDIRRGLVVFIIGLCLVGWGEIAQYVRAEFIQIKKQPYVESARAIGLNSLELAVRHVLPNVLPALVVITLLEMGAVLMILGELGFVGVFIGGGTAVQVGDVAQQQYFTVPEWGAMMAGSRQWARVKPWMVLGPAVAFFASVTGFNLMGEGLRRLIDRGIFNTAVLLSWRVLIVAAIITAASVYVIMALGPAPSYRHLARQVDRDALMDHVAFLSASEMKGRGVGTPEAERAVKYIVDAFERYGLSAPPGGRLGEVALTLARPAGPPELSLIAEDGETRTAFTRWADYSESTERHGGSGEAEAPVTLVVFSSEVRDHERHPEERYAAFKGLDLRGRIALILAGNAPGDFDTEALIRGAEGVLIVSDDVPPGNQVLEGDYLEQPTFPVFRITPETADVMLVANELDVETVRDGYLGVAQKNMGWIAKDLETRARMRVQLEPPETITASNVLGFVRGSDAALDEELVVVSCHYDGLGQGPDGTVYPGANGDGSGVAVMLEIIRLWHEQEFQPRRSVLFAAWAGGEMPYSGAHIFRDVSTLFAQHDISAVIHLDRLGSAREGGLIVHQRGSDLLYGLLVSSASELGVRVNEGPTRQHPYQQFITGHRGDSHVALNGSLVVTWGNPRRGLDADTLDEIDPEHLRQAAEVVNLTLIRAAHEPRY